MFSSNALKLLFVSAITLLGILIGALLYQYNEALSKAFTNIENIEQINVEAFAKNIENGLKQRFFRELENPFDVPDATREEIDALLSMFVGEKYAYIFIIALDQKGKLRYIFDGSKNPEDKGQYLQKFDPASDKWEDVVKTHKSAWITQHSLTGLWITYLYPIIMNGEVKSILAFDFSTKEYHLIKKTFSPINSYIMLIAFLLGIFLVLIYLFGWLLNRQRKKTFVDSLTGAYNRHYLNSISHHLKLRDICIALIDIDHFKKVNDIYGHDTGDEVLKKFSSSLSQAIRPEDILIRYGGEEFLLFLSKEDMKEGDDEKMINSLQERISGQVLNIGGENLKITASTGFNATPHLNRSLEEAISFADKMLYTAKINGRNRVEIFKEERRLEDAVFGPREVTQALHEDRVQAFYQPIMDAKSKSIAKYEMLIRIFTQSGSMILPYKFIPNIRGNTSYREITKFMLNKAFKTIQEHNVAVSLNFDVGDFLDLTLYEQIYIIVEKHQSIAQHLTIELLENIEVENFQLIIDHIEKIKALGIKVAIDDFGAGYSTFNYLLNLKPDILKIDGCLIKELCDSKDVQVVVKSIIDICKRLGVQTVAEFVENDDIIQQATLMDIDFLQGYAIGKPSPSLKIVR